MKIDQENVWSGFCATGAQVCLVLALLLVCTFSVSAQSNTFPSSGSAGVGTTSPGQKVEVYTTTNADGIKLNDGTIDSRWLIDTGSVAHGIGTVSNHPFYLFTGGTSKLWISAGGSVGIGTTSPTSGYNLDVRGQIIQYTPWANFVVKDSNGAGYAVASFVGQNGTGGILDVGVEGSSPGIVSTTAAGDGIISTRNNKKLVLGTNSTGRVTIDTSGKVGIGNPSPSTALDVNGTITATNVVAKFQDVAEWVPAAEQLAAGTVVVLDSTKSNQVTSSSVSYDTRVAGVVSEEPGIALGEKSEGKVLVATTGRVRVMVDATKSPIHIGDLLVTSDVPGVAMKSEPVNLGSVQIHRPGTLIGKALEPLEKGKGSILVLLSLQ